MPSRRHSSAMLSSPRKPDSTMRIFSSAVNCRRVARRISFTTCSAGFLTGPDFCPIFAPSMATMGQKSSLLQLSQSVSYALMPDTSYIAGDLAKWLDERKIKHLRGAPYHPMTQGKIERWHQTLKNRILLENYFLPGDLETQIAAFVDDYNHRRYHESIDNLTPADVYFGRGPTILAERERIKRQTIANRRLQHRLQAA